MAQYVRHISGVGERWLVQDKTGYNSETTHADWCVHRNGYGTLFLPKSEYVICEAEARWVDVTTDCDTIEDFLYEQTETMGKRDVASVKSYYRLRKVWLRHADNTPKWAFIVERLVSHE